ncbi:MAG: hypothetical protein IT578_01795 [Verrucomicrobiae bacterium]|nr:hypothetical protein [Verrucomicrobiae bacterium]
MKRNLLLSLLVAGGLTLAPSRVHAESPSDELERLRVEVSELEVRLADPGAASQQAMLRRALRDKVRRMKELQQVLRPGAVPAPANSLAAMEAGRSPAPPPAHETATLPRATLPPPKLAAAPSREAPPPSPAGLARPTEAAGSPATPLVIYAARELKIGPGTLADFDEVARRLRLGEDAAAQREWESYVAGERDSLSASPGRLSALIHFVVRRAYIEPDAELALAAEQVDVAREKAEAAVVAGAQDAFTARLRAKADLTEKIRKALRLLQESGERVLPSSR